MYDGPGIRTTVFLKGCPLRCQWCHNPEGLSSDPEIMVNTASCTRCFICKQNCPTPGHCTACGQCVSRCPGQFRRIVGQKISSGELAARLRRSSSLIDGVTFSGGEPLLQWPFVQEVIEQIPGMHTAIETSGYSSDDLFESALHAVSLIMMDIKLIDPVLHKHYTGVENQGILRHVDMLSHGNKPFIIRLPIIPGVNDNDAHFMAVAAMLKNATRLQRIEILPYNKTAGAKYRMVSRTYRPEFHTEQRPYICTSIFEQAGLPFVVY